MHNILTLWPQIGPSINPTPPSSDEYHRYDTVPLIDYMGQGWKTDVEALEYLKTKKSARKLISRQAWTYMYQGAGVMYIALGPG